MKKSLKDFHCSVDLLILGLVMAAAAYMRFAYIDAEPLWYDEALTIPLSKYSVWELFSLPTDPTPPLYYLLHKLMLPVTATAGQMRLISAVCGMASVVVMYIFGRLVINARGGAVAAGLLAVWPVHVSYSQEARAYALLFLLTLSASAALAWYTRILGFAEREQSEEGSRHTALALFGFCSVLSFYTHFVATIWIFISSALLFAIALHKSRGHAREVLILLSLMGLALIPGIYRYIAQFPTPDGFVWLKQATPKEVLNTLKEFSLPRGLLKLTLALLVLSIWINRKRLTSPKTLMLPLLFVGAYTLYILLLWGIGFVSTPIFMLRTLIPALPAAILPIAFVCSGQWGKLVQGLGAIMFMVLYGQVSLAENRTHDKEDWRGAARVLESGVRAGDVVLVCGRQGYPALRHAISKGIAAPVLLERDEPPLILEERLGYKANWDSAFFSNVTKVDYLKTRSAHMISRHREIQRSINVATGASLWLVDIRCWDTPPDLLGRWISKEPIPLEKHWTGATGRPEIFQYKLNRQVQFEAIDPSSAAIG